MHPSFTIYLSDQQKAILEAKAAAAGISTTGGTLPETHGIVLEFIANGNEVLFTILKKPFYVTDGMVIEGTKAYISQQGQG